MTQFSLSMSGVEDGERQKAFAVCGMFGSVVDAETPVGCGWRRVVSIAQTFGLPPVLTWFASSSVGQVM
jgi:hypothetical protein